MLSVPPPKSGAAGAVEIEMPIVSSTVSPWLASRSTLFGSVSMAWVIVPRLMNDVRSCGIRGGAVIGCGLARERNRALRGRPRRTA